MRVALIVPSLLNKAPVIVARDLADGLMRKNIDVTVFHLDDKRELEFPCEVKRLGLWSWSDLQSFDVIHSHMLRPDLLVGFLRGAGFLRRSCATTIHNIIEEDLGNSHRHLVVVVAAYFWRLAWSAFDERVVVSAHARSYYAKSKSYLTYSVIENGRSLEGTSTIAFKDEALISQLRSKYKVLGSFANVSLLKGLEQVIKALPQLKGCVFLIIGDGPALSTLLTLAEELGVSDRVFAIGYRPNARAYMRHVDCYLMPSRSEGMPLALVEAGLAKRPIVCSDIPALRAMFDDGEAVFFALDAIGDLVRAINQALDNADQYGLASFRKVSENYSLERMVEKYLAVYARLSGGGVAEKLHG